ncbi:MAG: quinol:cytochrome C oxidoreductase [Flavobacteriales bacterium]|nr:quinol:cytochrome C oxidoreductase [Flavobacteriales bacterium]
MGVGVLATVAGVLGDHSDHHQRTWSALLVNGFFFFGIGLGALFFYSLQNATETAWSVLVKRVYEAVMGWIPVGAIVMVVVLAAGSMGLHHVYHWMDASLYVEGPNYDPIMAGKKAFLNQPFFWVRTLAYIGTFVFAARWFRKKSLEMDGLTGESLVRTHLLTYRRGALFLVFFAVFSSTLAWDWLMSIDAHWFSTLFGWYVFSGMWVSAMITGVVMVLYLKRKGYLPQVNNSHIHDMGKWVFAVSFLWTYLYFSQFMLIWYSNIPEEVTYFQQRINEHPGLMWTTFFINFAVPMVLLMSRDAKRNPRFLIGVGTVIFIGHWMDINMIVMPGAVGHHFHGLGLLDAGLFVLFLGAFIRVVLGTLAKAPLTPVNHPYLEESVHHSI